MEERHNFMILRNYPKERRFIITRQMQKGFLDSLKDLITEKKVS